MSVYIGIDPDIDKSGVAYYESLTKDYKLMNLGFFELLDYLDGLKQTCFSNVLVVVEGGWLNKSNWHTQGKSQRISTLIGKHTGENHQVGKKIVEMCEYLKIPYSVVRPTKAKLNSDSFKTITGIKERTNAEQRDAFMLVFGR